MALIRLSEVVKKYKGEILLENISMQINNLDRIGLIGINGSGKTTLMDIIAGKKEEDAGGIERANNVKMGYLPQTLSWTSTGIVEDYLWEAFSKQLALRKKLSILEEQISTDYQKDLLIKYSSVRDEYEAGGGYSCESKIRGIVNGLGFEESALKKELKAFSGGEKTKLALAKLLLEENEILLLDEPTNHLDLENREWLALHLKNYSGALLLISHDRYFLNEVANKIIELEDKRIINYKGNYDAYLEQRNLKIKTWNKEYQKQQQEIQGLEDFIRRYKAGQRSKEARSREKRLERMTRLTPPPKREQKLKLRFKMQTTSGAEVLTVKDLNLWRGGRQLLSKVNLELRRGDRAALLGPNGTGKTSLIRALLGFDAIEQGEINWGYNVKKGYFEQEGKELSSEKKLFEIMADEGLNLKQDIMDYLGKFRFSGDQTAKKVKYLSGGERARLNLALLVRKNFNTLILDEPTNHLDLLLQQWLEWSLKQFEGTIIFTSHDRYFIENLANVFWVLERGRIISYRGNYQEFLVWREKKRKSFAADNNKNVNVKGPQTNFQRGKLKERTQLENDIEQLEIEISNLEQLFAQKDFYQRQDSMKLLKQFKDLTQQKEKLYQKWEQMLEEV